MAPLATPSATAECPSARRGHTGPEGKCRPSVWLLVPWAHTVLSGRSGIYSDKVEVQESDQSTGPTNLGVTPSHRLCVCVGGGQYTPRRSDAAVTVHYRRSRHGTLVNFETREKLSTGP